MVLDGGAPRCGECGRALQFDTDREGRTTESCGSGHRGFLKMRPYDAASSVMAGAPVAITG
jgi:hypothetical protein